METPEIISLAPHDSPNQSAGPGGAAGGVFRSFVRPLSGALQSIGIKDKITADIAAAALMVLIPSGILFFFLRKKRK